MYTRTVKVTGRLDVVIAMLEYQGTRQSCVSQAGQTSSCFSVTVELHKRQKTASRFVAKNGASMVRRTTGSPWRLLFIGIEFLPRQRANGIVDLPLLRGRSVPGGSRGFESRLFTCIFAVHPDLMRAFGR